MTRIGAGGAFPPTEEYYDTRATGPLNINTLCRQSACPELIPDVNGIDFMEALEGMKVSIDDPVVTGPTARGGGTWVLPDAGSWATSVNKDGLAYVSPPGDAEEAGNSKQEKV